MVAGASNGCQTCIPKRYLPCFVFALIIFSLQLYIVTFKTIRCKNNDHAADEFKQHLHVLIVGYARTGSTFLGDLLQSLSNVFYVYEPLFFLSRPTLVTNFDRSRDLIANIMSCNTAKVPGYLDWEKSMPFLKSKRKDEFWNECKRQNSCYEDAFVDAYCRKSDVILAKTVRLFLGEAAKMFKTHPQLKLKIIYLTRDPRASEHSRIKNPVATWWCKADPFCNNTESYCSKLEDDHRTACTLLQQRPQDFTIIRYEDLAVNPYKTTEQLVRFLGLNAIPISTLVFLEEHTKSKTYHHTSTANETAEVEYAYSTFRNSSSETASAWRHVMPFQRVQQIQKVCSGSLNAFGYFSYPSETWLLSDGNYDSRLEDALKSSCSRVTNNWMKQENVRP